MFSSKKTRRVFVAPLAAAAAVALALTGCSGGLAGGDDGGGDEGPIKIGMLGSPEIAHMVADILETVSAAVVFDPVMVATTGSVLADDATVRAFDRLMQLAMLTTPNVPELAALGGPDAMVRRRIACLAKGGDAEGPIVEDRLIRPGQPDRIWRDDRIYTRHTHGTGCTLSSAIATRLAQGLSLEDAIGEARLFVRASLRAAPGLGRGNGPMGQHAVR